MVNSKGWPELDTIEDLESSYERGKEDGMEEAREEHSRKNMLLFCLEKLKEAEERGISIQQLYFEIESESLTL